jgi:outer membrane protein OmpA-like peptidoglycan-associated protein
MVDSDLAHRIKELPMSVRIASRMRMALGAAWMVTLAGCASTPPNELLSARQAYQRAQAGEADTYSPAQLEIAHEALERAEMMFAGGGDTGRMREGAFLAMRHAERAELQARILQGVKDLEALRPQEPPQPALAARGAERAASPEVITISGSLLFPRGKAKLLRSAESQLDVVAQMLSQMSPKASIVVEGHADAQGSETFNLDLSARRAEAVRAFLIARGVPSDRVRATGLGFSKPSEAPGIEARPRARELGNEQATSRRVEIVVRPASAPVSTLAGI